MCAVSAFLLCTALALPQAARAAVLYAGSAYQLVEEGQTFVVDWFLDTEGQAINTLSLDLKFTGETIEVVDIGPGQSILSLWISYPQFSNDQGTIRIIGGAPNGFNSKTAPIFRTTFRAKQPGTARVTMAPSSAALLNDGSGAQASLKFQVLNFIVGSKGILPVTIVSETHPDQDRWYRERSVRVKFIPRPGEDYSYSFSSNLDIFPDEVTDETAQLTYEDLPDGIYYFKLNSKTVASNWQESGIYRFQIDATPPEQFTPLIDRHETIFSGEPFLSFSTVDKTSGISYYEVKTGWFQKFQETQSPFKLRRPLIGDKIQVTAYDHAGNAQIAKVDFPGILNVWQFVSLLALIAAGGVVYFLRRMKTK